LPGAFAAGAFAAGAFAAGVFAAGAAAGLAGSAQREHGIGRPDEAGVGQAHVAHAQAVAVVEGRHVDHELDGEVHRLRRDLHRAVRRADAAAFDHAGGAADDADRHRAGDLALRIDAEEVDVEHVGAQRVALEIRDHAGLDADLGAVMLQREREQGVEALGRIAGATELAGVDRDRDVVLARAVDDGGELARTTELAHPAFAGRGSHGDSENSVFAHDALHPLVGVFGSRVGATIVGARRRGSRFVPGAREQVAAAIG
jgi:hypothetical protein